MRIVKFLVELVFFHVEKFNFIFDTYGVDFILCDVRGRGCDRNFYVGIVQDYFFGKALSIEENISATL